MPSFSKLGVAGEGALSRSEVGRTRMMQVDGPFWVCKMLVSQCQMQLLCK